MQTLMLTIEYDGTRYTGWKATSKKGASETISGKSKPPSFVSSEKKSRYSVLPEPIRGYTQENRFSALRLPRPLPLSF